MRSIIGFYVKIFFMVCVCVFVSIIGYIYNVCISRILSTVRPLRERNKISKCKHDKMNCVFRFLVVELAEINLF